MIKTVKMHQEEDLKNELYTLETFSFDDPSTKQSIQIKIQQVISEDYGLYIWPSSKVLAEFIWRNRKRFEGKKLLELGAGTSLPGLVAAACGAYVILTDKEDENIQKNMRMNKINNNPVEFNTDGIKVPLFISDTIDIMSFTWGQFSAEIIGIKQLDYVIGADCFYDNSEDYENIIASVVYFLNKNPKTIFLTSYQERSSQRSIHYLLKKWGLTAKEISLSTFFPFKKYKLTETVHLIQISLSSLESVNNE
eukprot:TRINITY_DN4160_c0_g1_i1.p1 TRINITY_DN4160_c0_g1~~TRINITY_DN4160_c0_g1_i1.p1  ORF type:complete len:251 (-),score=32.35 TRINITY_DN4160_c0_g1_i1:426-1178(-)